MHYFIMKELLNQSMNYSVTELHRHAFYLLQTLHMTHPQHRPKIPVWSQVVNYSAYCAFDLCPNDTEVSREVKHGRHFGNEGVCLQRRNILVSLPYVR